MNSQELAVLIDSFRPLDTAAISDALDRCGIDGQPVGIRPLDRDFQICGPAFTVLYADCEPGSGGTVGDFVDDVAPGSVIVIDNNGRLDATIWGDLMTTTAHRNGIGGTVIDGVSRDTLRAIELDYPIFARSTFMRTGKDRVAIQATEVSVHLGGLPVAPGDLLCGDADGLVIVPKDRASEVLRAAQEIADAEDDIRQGLNVGLRLDEARRKAGYHKLQTRRPTSK